jgi:hypothetical protein
MSIINDIASFIGSVNKKTLKYLIIIIVLIAVLYPYIEKVYVKNYIIRQEIEILDKVSSINTDNFSTTAQKELYDKILKEIEQGNEQINLVFDPLTTIRNDIGKFLAGSILWFIVFFILMFSKTVNIGQKIASGVFVLIIAFFMGYLGTIISVVKSTLLCFILYPTIQLVFLYSLIPMNFKKSE